MMKNYNIYLSNQGFGGRKENRVGKFHLLFTICLMCFGSLAQGQTSIPMFPANNTVFTGSCTMGNHDIIVKRGNTVTFDNVTLDVNGCSQISVEPEATLIITNSYLYSTSHDGWKGIRVQADNQGAGDKGAISINGSTISNAKIAILFGVTQNSASLGSYAYDTDSAGGNLILCEENTFSRNEEGIVFLPSLNPITKSISNCFFKEPIQLSNCEIINQKYWYNNAPINVFSVPRTGINDGNEFIKVYGREDLSIIGCTFNMTSLSTNTADFSAIKVIGQSNFRANNYSFTDNVFLGNTTDAVSCENVSDILIGYNNFNLATYFNSSVLSNSQGAASYLYNSDGITITRNNVSAYSIGDLYEGFALVKSNGDVTDNQITFSNTSTFSSMPGLSGQGILFEESKGSISGNQIKYTDQTGTVNRFSSLYDNTLGWEKKRLYGIRIEKPSSTVQVPITENTCEGLDVALYIVSPSSNTGNIYFSCNQFIKGNAGVFVEGAITDQGDATTPVYNYFGGTNELNNLGDLYTSVVPNGGYNYYVNNNWTAPYLEPKDNNGNTTVSSHKILGNAASLLQKSISTKGYAKANGEYGGFCCVQGATEPGCGPMQLPCNFPNPDNIPSTVYIFPNCPDVITQRKIQTQNSVFKAYPNPFKDAITIELPVENSSVKSIPPTNHIFFE